MILDGRVVSQEVQSETQRRAREFALRHGRRPGLAVVMVGDDPASRVYVRNKIKACGAVGVQSTERLLPETATEDEVIRTVRELNDDPTVDALLVQLPLPPELSRDRILAAIDPRKDADGLSAVNLGRLVLKQPGPRPCTPHGVMKILEHYRIPLKGREAVVVGRSQIVGLPMALLLQQADCTVTVCHSATRDLKAHTQRADLVIAAAGRPRFLGPEFFRDGAVVVDVGIHRLGRGADGKEQLCGDVDFDRVKGAVAALTPVPGGVGPMTIAMLLWNAVECADQLVSGARQ